MAAKKSTLGDVKSDSWLDLSANLSTLDNKEQQYSNANLNNQLQINEKTTNKALNKTQFYNESVETTREFNALLRSQRNNVCRHSSLEPSGEQSNNQFQQIIRHQFRFTNNDTIIGKSNMLCLAEAEDNSSLLRSSLTNLSDKFNSKFSKLKNSCKKLLHNYSNINFKKFDENSNQQQLSTQATSKRPANELVENWLAEQNERINRRAKSNVSFYKRKLERPHSYIEPSSKLSQVYYSNQQFNNYSTNNNYNNSTTTATINNSSSLSSSSSLFSVNKVKLIDEFDKNARRFARCSSEVASKQLIKNVINVDEESPSSYINCIASCDKQQQALSKNINCVEEVKESINCKESLPLKTFKSSSLTLVSTSSNCNNESDEKPTNLNNEDCTKQSTTIDDDYTSEACNKQQQTTISSTASSTSTSTSMFDFLKLSNSNNSNKHCNSNEKVNIECNDNQNQNNRRRNKTATTTTASIKDNVDLIVNANNNNNNNNIIKDGFNQHRQESKDFCVNEFQRNKVDERCSLQQQDLNISSKFYLQPTQLINNNSSGSNTSWQLQPIADTDCDKLKSNEISYYSSPTPDNDDDDDNDADADNDDNNDIDYKPIDVNNKCLIHNKAINCQQMPFNNKQQLLDNKTSHHRLLNYSNYTYNQDNNNENATNNNNIKHQNMLKINQNYEYDNEDDDDDNDDDYAVPSDEDYLLERNQVELVQMIGEGQRGFVFLGKLQSRNGLQLTDVAIKTLKYETELNLNKLMCEAALMRQLEHPHIIKFYGVCAQTPALIAMELAVFGEARQYLRDNRHLISASQLCLFVFQISTALSYIESKRLVHRDVAARNVLVSTPDCVKLADFGLSRSLASQPLKNVNRALNGANSNNCEQLTVASSSDEPCYTAPRGKLPVRWLAPESLAFRLFTSSSDVWMFAVCAWELFNFGLVRPWAEIRNNQVLRALQDGSRLAKPQACPLRLYELLTACWSFAPAKRPKFKDLKHDLWSIYLHERALEQKHASSLRRKSRKLLNSSSQMQRQQQQHHQLLLLNRPTSQQCKSNAQFNLSPFTNNNNTSNNLIINSSDKNASLARSAELVSNVSSSSPCSSNGSSLLKKRREYKQQLQSINDANQALMSFAVNQRHQSSNNNFHQQSNVNALNDCMSSSSFNAPVWTDAQLINSKNIDTNDDDARVSNDCKMQTQMQQANPATRFERRAGGRLLQKQRSQGSIQALDQRCKQSNNQRQSKLADELSKQRKLSINERRRRFINERRPLSVEFTTTISEDSKLLLNSGSDDSISDTNEDEDFNSDNDDAEYNEQESDEQLTLANTTTNAAAVNCLQQRVPQTHVNSRFVNRMQANNKKKKNINNSNVGFMQNKLRQQSNNISPTKQQRNVDDLCTGLSEIAIIKNPATNATADLLYSMQPQTVNSYNCLQRKATVSPPTGALRMTDTCNHNALVAATTKHGSVSPTQMQMQRHEYLSQQYDRQELLLSNAEQQKQQQQQQQQQFAAVNSNNHRNKQNNKDFNKSHQANDKKQQQQQASNATKNVTFHQQASDRTQLEANCDSSIVGTYANHVSTERQRQALNNEHHQNKLQSNANEKSAESIERVKRREQLELHQRLLGRIRPISTSLDNNSNDDFGQQATHSKVLSSPSSSSSRQSQAQRLAPTVDQSLQLLSSLMIDSNWNARRKQSTRYSQNNDRSSNNNNNDNNDTNLLRHSRATSLFVDRH